MLPWLHNLLVGKNWFKIGLRIAQNRSLPTLQNHTLHQWFLNYTQEKSAKKVYLFCDEYTNYYDTHIGKKAIFLLNKLGYEILMIKHKESGRAYISKGFLKQAKVIATSNVRQFASLISDRIPLIGIEPSAILSFRDEYPNLVDRSLKQQAIKLSKSVFLIEEFISNEIDAYRIVAESFTEKPKSVIFHGHCHQKALALTSSTKNILELPYNYTANEINSGCCGMAGSFGYEEEHYDLSQKIANQVLFPEIKKMGPDTILVTNGTSCRHQIYDGLNIKSKHPIEVLYEALK